MTPTGVDLKVVHDRLAIVAACVADLRRLPLSALQEFRADWRNPAAADSLLRRAIEALFDAVRHLLGKGFGLGALEYREAARLAVEKAWSGTAPWASASARSQDSAIASPTSTET